MPSSMKDGGTTLSKDGWDNGIGYHQWYTLGNTYTTEYAKPAKERDLAKHRVFSFEKRKANATVACHKIKLVKQNKKKAKLHV